MTIMRPDLVRGLIILDGPDGGGKTTLAKELCRRFNGKYIHMTYRWKNNQFAYHTAALHHAISLSNTQLVVIDRLWMSESIYADVYRGGSKWPHMGRMMDRVIRKHSGMYVMCMARNAYLHMARFRDLATSRQEMYKPDENMEKVWSMYNTLWNGNPYFQNGVSYYDDICISGGMMNRKDAVRYSIEVEGENLDKFIDRLIRRMQVYQTQQTPIGSDHTFHNFLGYAPGAKYLMVGDKLSDARFKKLGWPFYAYQNCSLYMAEQLSRMGFDESLACWTNVNEPFGLKVISYLCEEYGLKMIALGIEALRPIDHKNITGQHQPGCTRHPQYYSRWQRYTDNFIDDLKEAMVIKNETAHLENLNPRPE